MIHGHRRFSGFSQWTGTHAAHLQNSQPAMSHTHANLKHREKEMLPRRDRGKPDPNNEAGIFKRRREPAPGNQNVKPARKPRTQIPILGPNQNLPEGSRHLHKDMVLENGHGILYQGDHLGTLLNQYYLHGHTAGQKYIHKHLKRL